MYCVKCVQFMSNWRLRVVVHSNSVCISFFDKKYICSSLKKVRDNEHVTRFKIAKSVLGSLTI